MLILWAREYKKIDKCRASNKDKKESIINWYEIQKDEVLINPLLSVFFSFPYHHHFLFFSCVDNWDKDENERTKASFTRKLTVGVTMLRRFRLERGFVRHSGNGYRSSRNIISPDNASPLAFFLYLYSFFSYIFSL